MYSTNTTRRDRLLNQKRFDFGALFTRAQWITSTASQVDHEGANCYGDPNLKAP